MHVVMEDIHSQSIMSVHEQSVHVPLQRDSVKCLRSEQEQLVHVVMEHVHSKSIMSEQEQSVHVMRSLDNTLNTLILLTI